MLESQNHSKSWVKPEELVVERSLIGWESWVDPRYIDFGEVNSSALHPYNTKSCGIRVGPYLFRLVSVLA